MKYLNSYNEGFIDKVKNFNICKFYFIDNYKTNKDGSIDVDGDVSFHNRKLKKLPIKFNNVTGDFKCSYNKLTTLKGSPNYVGGSFDCSYNNLTSLDGIKISSAYDFDCSHNNLTSFVGLPEHVEREFDFSYNNIWSLEGFPKSVGFWSGTRCPVNTILNCFFYVKIKEFSARLELFNDYDIIRDNVILLDRLDSFLRDVGIRQFGKIHDNRYANDERYNSLLDVGYIFQR